MSAGSGIRVGCTGWQIPPAFKPFFPEQGSTLQRYAARFPAVEISTSFYRLHKPDTYQRWSETTPSGFCFSVKVLKEITHAGGLQRLDRLNEFLYGVNSLGSKLGPLLLQLPPSLAFDLHTVESFFAALRGCFEAAVVCEPRHPSWLDPQADKMLRQYRIARVAADPANSPAAAAPGGWGELVYYRLHGSPRMYYSPYTPDFLAALKDRLLQAAAAASAVWCIFDNVASGAATMNALTLLDLLDR